MKKWPLTILAALALIALGLTARFWLPRLLQFAVHDDTAIEKLKNLVELVAPLAGAGLVLFKWLRDKPEPQGSTQAPAVTVHNTHAGHDVIATGGNVQTGRVSAQGNVSAAGDVVGGNKYEIHEAPLPVINALHSLPPPPADFTGRETELAELHAAMETGGVTISGLQGQGGVGKTALALKLAEELAPKYPDAQIYLDLRGASEKPLTPSEALAYVIRAFHPEAKLPESEAELSATYQSILHGKRALLLMDNARDAAQVRPLIPPAGCALLVTSRHHFVLPGLYPRNLDTLPPTDAKALLLVIAPRIDGEAETISRLCGYLPLALRLAASAIAERMDLAPADYARRLADENERLRLLAGSDQSVEASIGLSYRLLDTDVQKRWRALAVFPDTFDAPAAAAIWTVGVRLAAPENAPLATPQDALSRLVQYSMLNWNETTRRYRLHDLMRDFARAKSEPAEREAAARGHAAYYADVLASADGLYLKGGEAIGRGLALFDLEWGNIQAGQAWAAARGPGDAEAAKLCSLYPDAGVYCLALRQHPRDRIRWVEDALAAARQLKNRGAEGAHLGNLGNSYDSLGEYRRAIEYHEQALTIAREIGDRQGEGAVLGNLGNAYHSLGEYRRAIEYHEQHLAIAREIGDRRGEGQALGNLGNAYYSLGEYRRAIEYHEQALAIDRDIGDRRGEGQDLGNLGIAYGRLDEYRRAIEYQEQDLIVVREIGDRQGEGVALGNLGLVYHRLGEYRRAIEYHEQHLTIARELGDRQGEGRALGNLGNAYYRLGEYRRAIEYYEQALAIAREISDRQGQGNALCNVSLTLDKLGRRAEAIQHAEAALTIFEQIEDPNAAKVRTRLQQWKQ
ncbi:MAG TPA: tetratricopeptide repeat protein [Terriglobia bacterium]|nr:tetratricopeptide repeat protein [Terriglobia bacterium]